MAVSTHRIHTIHNSFGAPSLFASSMNAQASWDLIPNVCAPRIRPSSRTYEQAPTPRSPSPSRAAYPNMDMPIRAAGASSGSRPRRITISSGSDSPRRAPPPPPAPAERTAPASLSTARPRVLDVDVDLPEPTPTLISLDLQHAQDPFEDPLEPLTPFPSMMSASFRPRVALPSSTGPQSAPSRSKRFGTPASASPCLPPGIPSAKDMLDRRVANALLSRRSGRSLGVYLRRRQLCAGQNPVYVKSGLSQLVAAAA